MRVARFLLPLTLSLTLVGCDAWMQSKPVDGATMEKDDAMMEGDAMMRKDDVVADGDGMMKNDAMMDAEGEVMRADGEAMMKKEGQPMMAKGSYAAYTPAVLANGEVKVLFFHVAWCPMCEKADARLNAWYAANAYGRSAYKVDYDNSNDLKAKYGVTYQHTFVLVDGQGNALQVIQGPTDVQIQELLGA